MIIALPLNGGQVGDGWGRAHNVAIADVDSRGAILSFEEYEVSWDTWHDQAGEGQHHARIAKFLMDHHVNRVITGHMGSGMVHMLDKMQISVVQQVRGSAREMAARFGTTESSE